MMLSTYTCTVVCERAREHVSVFSYSVCMCLCASHGCISEMVHLHVLQFVYLCVPVEIQMCFYSHILSHCVQYTCAAVSVCA